MNAFIELADYIDDVYLNPYHLPHDKDRAFVKIFKRLLTEEEARFAMFLGSRPESAEQIGERAGVTAEECEERLRVLSGKGIAFSRVVNGSEQYNLSPFCPGILEFLQSAYLDCDISGYLQEYVDEINRYLDSQVQKKGKHSKELPLHIAIDVRPYSLSLEEAVQYIDRSSRYSLSDCMCRAAKHMLGEGCDHTVKDMCIQTGEYADFYIRTGRAREVSREEVIGVLKKASAEHLFHEATTSGTMENSYFICNCCPCCCISLRTVLTGRIQGQSLNENRPAAEIKKDQCNVCGMCIDACPQGAVSDSEHAANADACMVIDTKRCIGCGLCVLICKENAITIKSLK